MTAPPRSPLALASLPAAPTRGGWLVLCGALLCLGRVGGKDRLEPVRRSAPTNPRAGSRHRTPKKGGELGRPEGEALLPGHGETLPEKKKNAMRKIILANRYALRILYACPTTI
jgi:hypothetical protein